MLDKIWASGKLRLVITGGCNISCFYCHNEGQPKASTYLTEPLFERVLDLMHFEAPEVVTITGGEPLLHPGIEHFVARLRQYCQSVTMVSNCLLLTEARTSTLIAAGLTKFRIGVDSFSAARSRPTSGTLPAVSIKDTVLQLLSRGLAVELNVVLTRFNENEITAIVRFCGERRISAKVFEHVEVLAYGDGKSLGQMQQKPIVRFDDFRSAVFGSGMIRSESTPTEYTGANHVFFGDGFSVRYCRYLCPFGLCYKTGTRIDPDGTAYACMEKRGAMVLDLEEPIERAVEKLHAVVQVGCGRHNYVGKG